MIEILKSLETHFAHSTEIDCEQKSRLRSRIIKKANEFFESVYAEFNLYSDEKVPGEFYVSKCSSNRAENIVYHTSNGERAFIEVFLSFAYREAGYLDFETIMKIFTKTTSSLDEIHKQKVRTFIRENVELIIGLPDPEYN